MATMELEEDQICYSGCIPEFGAIFMSNTRTKVECLGQKLFGLPSRQAPFVKQIKAGMILFLFEFERRELHGVYQASTDGAMNIVPHAYSSSGKQFPAQVKFTHLWHCSPLSEDEFWGAIKENYYSAKKFNFGLSEDQVHKLLCLFSLKKLKPQRHITRRKAARYSVDKFRRAADDRRSITSTQGEEADSSHGSVISTDHFGSCLGNDVRAIDDGRFATSARLGVDGAAISTLYPGQFEPSSTFCRSMEPQAMNLSYLTSTGDSTAVSCLPYDPDAPGIEYRRLSSNEHNSNPLQNIASPHNNNSENVQPSSENHSFLPYTEPRGTRCPDFSSVLGYGAPKASPNHHGNSQRTRIPFLEDFYSENMGANPSENEGFQGFSFPRPGRLPFSDSGNSDGMHGGTYYSFSPSQFSSFVFDYGCCEASQDKNNEKMLQCGINLKEGKSQLQGPVYPVKFNNIDYHDNSSFQTDDVCENSGGMYSNCQKNRKNVFSRLALAPKAHIRECDILLCVDEDSMDIPASEENDDQLAEKTPFVNFKRRSSKSHDSDSKIGVSGRSAETEGCASGLHKRRKLIRPNFSKRELIDNKSINVDSKT